MFDLDALDQAAGRGRRARCAGAARADAAQNVRHAEYLQHEVPEMSVPEAVLERMWQAGEASAAGRAADRVRARSGGAPPRPGTRAGARLGERLDRRAGRAPADTPTASRWQSLAIDELERTRIALRSLQAQNSMLRQLVAIHDRLGGLVLQGADIAAVTARWPS